MPASPASAPAAIEPWTALRPSELWRHGLVCGLVLVAACGGADSGMARVDAPSADVGNVPGQPGLGAHQVDFHKLFANESPINTKPMNTASSGSTFIVSIGRGDFDAFKNNPPTDNKGNTATQLDRAYTYNQWMSSGTALYAFTAMNGGADHIVSAATPPDDEITLAAVEVVNGTRIEAAVRNEVTLVSGDPLRSASVTTTGPATLVAFWWGDADVGGMKSVKPNSGFTRVAFVFDEGALVQCAVAVKNVAEPGTYDLTWEDPQPKQGAQMWLIAVQ